MNNNMFQLINMFKMAQNPQQMAMNMLSQYGKNNPMMNNVVGMIQNNDSKGIEQFARNLAKERNIDIDELMNEIKHLG